MKTWAVLGTVVVVVFVGGWGGAAEPGDISRLVLPLPQSVQREAGTLVLTGATSISLTPGSEVVGGHFAQRLRRGTGWGVPVVSAGKGTIHLEIAVEAGKSPEAYSLTITAAGVQVRAAAAAGLARGVETLMQLMPAAVYGTNPVQTLTLPALSIADAPRFAWRGAMLDVSRRFQDKETVLKLLEGLAACKLNIFHWHLTDDQGWRLPIAGYPKLTEKGAAYSRADVAEVVERAAELGITIVPEVDMPGHSSASCRAYPAISTLNDKGQPTGTMNPGAEASYEFIDAVMKDLAAQFPNSPYVHIGADEVGAGGWGRDEQCRALMQREKLKGNHELYVYFVNRVVGIARSHGKRSIAWDEAFDAKNDPELIIMSWRGMGPGIAAAKAGRTVIFAPNPPLYINHANSRSRLNPRAYSAHTGYLNQIYFVHADTPAIPAEIRGRVLGAEVCLWGECITDARNMFVHMFPRVGALAENLWAPRGQLDWGRFLGELEMQNRRWEAMGIPFFWETETLAVDVGSLEAGEVAARNGVLEFSLEGKLRQAGEQEIFLTQGTGEGRFRVEAVELVKEGVVVDADRHGCELSVYANVSSIYIVKNPEVSGRYAVRIRGVGLAGQCGVRVQLIPALAADGYSKQCAPGSGANRSKQVVGP